MSAAYDASLAPIHPWVLRKSLPAAFKLAPTRNGFLDQLSQCHQTAVKDMHKFIQSNGEVRLSEWVGCWVGGWVRIESGFRHPRCSVEPQVGSRKVVCGVV